MATFRTRTFENVSNIQGRWYEVAPAEMTIRAESSATGTLAGHFGTNASFFNPGTNALTAMHVANGQAVATGGLTNTALGTAASSMSALFCDLWFMDPMRVVRFQNRAQNFTDLPRPNPQFGTTLWAIGGITLLANENINLPSNFRQRLLEIYGSGAASWIPGLDQRRARTFIGYRSATDRIMFGVLSRSISDSSIGDTTGNTGTGVTFHEMHLILRQELGCNMALSIDGGGSSRIRFRNAQGQDVLSQVGARRINAQLALAPNVASTVNWNGR